MIVTLTSGSAAFGKMENDFVRIRLIHFCLVWFESKMEREEKEGLGVRVMG